MFGSLQSDGQSTLAISSLTAVEITKRVIEAGFEQLVVIVHEEDIEPLIEAWVGGGGDPGRIRGIAIDELMRSSAASAKFVGGTPPLIQSVPLEQLEGLPVAISSMQDEEGDIRTAVYVTGILGVLRRVGPGRIDTLLRRLAPEITNRGSHLLVGVPSTVPVPVTLGLAARLDRVVKLGESGEVTSPPPSATRGELSTDDALGLIRTDRRRYLLQILDERFGEAVSIDDLAERLAGKPIDETLAHDPGQVRIVLYQTDIPKLADAEVISVDSERDSVSLRPEAIQVWPCLSLALRMEGL